MYFVFLKKNNHVSLCAFKNIHILKGNKNIYKRDSFLLAKYERKRAKILFFQTMLNKSRILSLVSRGNEYASFSFRIMSICSIRNAIYLLSLAEDFSRGEGRAKPLLALSSLLCCLEKKLLFECILTNTGRQLRFFHAVPVVYVKTDSFQSFQTLNPYLHNLPSKNASVHDIRCSDQFSKCDQFYIMISFQV